jgi:hypothetical protein
VYFDHIQDSKFDLTYIIRSILRQIVQRKGHVSDKIRHLYSEHKNSRDGRPLTLEDAINELDAELSDFSKVFIGLDVLDESNEDTRGVVLDKLNEFGRQNLRLMVTGRPYVKADVEEIFKGQAFEMLQIRAQDMDVE